MADLKITEASKTITITADPAVSATDPNVISFMQALGMLASKIPLASFLVQPDAVTPAKSFYRFIAKDGRQWAQRIGLGKTLQDAAMNYSVTDFFKPGEVDANIALRNNVVIPMLMAGTTKIVCTWV